MINKSNVAFNLIDKNIYTHVKGVNISQNSVELFYHKLTHLGLP